MKYKQQHKSILLLVQDFPSNSELEGNLLLLKICYEQFVESVNLLRYKSDYSSKSVENYYSGEDAVLVIGSKRRHPKTVLDKPFIEKDNKKAPVSWLPVRNATDLKHFAETVKEVHSRSQDDCIIALLSQKHPRFVRIVDRMNKILKDKIKPLQWSSDLVFREDIVRAMEEGIGLATYFGHGRPVGWVGYYGFRSHHFESKNAKPIGGLLSLCCNTASRKHTSLSFCEELVLNKTCAATFGAVNSTLHTDNTRWSVGLCVALAKGASTIGELVLQAMPQNISAYKYYRIIGDPLAPIYTSTQASFEAQKVKVYA